MGYSNVLPKGNPYLPALVSSSFTIWRISLGLACGSAFFMPICNRYSISAFKLRKFFSADALSSSYTSVGILNCV